MKYIKGFDTLRALSISMVVLAHCLPDFWLQEHRLWYLISGDTGVLIFFVISGYLITALLLKEKIENGYIDYKKFFARRFLRLLPPLVILYASVLILMTTGVIQETYIGLLISVVYLYNFVPNKFYTAELGHTWSLALEEQFYFTWPFVIGVLKSRKELIYLGGLVITLSIIFFFVIYPIEFLSHFKAQRWFIPAASPIMIGAITAIAQHKILDQVASSFWQFTSFLVLFSSPLFVPTSLLIIAPIFQSIGIAFLLLLIIDHQHSLGVKILNNPFTSYMGRISYGIYVYQGLFLRTGPGSENWFQQFPQNFVFTLTCAILSFELIEKHFLKKKKKYAVV